jgi:hypothetical protein
LYDAPNDAAVEVVKVVVPNTLVASMTAGAKPLSDIAPRPPKVVT